MSKASGRVGALSCASVVVTTSTGHSRECANPFCKAVIEPLNGGRWRRTERRHCTDECKRDHQALVRARAVLNRVGIIRFHDLMDEI